jgi:flagellar basal body-associated protein FliL
MAEKSEKKPDSAGAGTGSADSARSAGALLNRTPVMLGGVMFLEAVVLFAGFKFLSGGAAPNSADGAELASTEYVDGHGEDGGKAGKSIDRKKMVEVNVLDFKAPNKQSGRTFLYDVSIYVVTRAEFADKVKTTIGDREALIKDRIRTIIAQSDPEKLGGGSEPGLETLRRQVKYQLDEIIGEEVIGEVLVPRCIPFRTDY